MAMETWTHPHAESLYCPKCGQGFAMLVPDGDLKERLVCLDCQFVHYLNPLPVAAVVAERDGRVLLVRRDIEPQHGRWQVPGGFMEMGERAEDGAAREAAEEAGLELGELRLLNVYTARAGLVVVNFEAEAANDGAAHHEVSEVRWFAPGELPWDELAFRSSEHALRGWLGRRGLGAPAEWVTEWDG